MSIETHRDGHIGTAMTDYLGCECSLFAPMADDGPIMDAYRSAKEEGARKGFCPMLVRADEILWECLVMNACPGCGRSGAVFDREKVAQYRKNVLTLPLPEGKAVLDEMLGQRRRNAAAMGLDWEKNVLGRMEGGGSNDCFEGYWDPFTGRTFPLILAKIPVKHPWEVFAYLPFGGWNSCPDTPQLMAVAKYWFEQHGAAPAVMGRDTLEFELPAPVPEERAMELAAEHYAFCPDVDQGSGWSVGALADGLRRSTVWDFWWD